MTRIFKIRSVAFRISLTAIALVILSTAAVGAVSYALFRNNSIRYNAEKAVAIAQSIASFIDTQQIEQNMQSHEKTPYYEFLQRSVNQLITESNLAYLFVVEGKYDKDVTYIIIGSKPGDEWYGDLGTKQSTSLFSEKLLEAIDTGEIQTTKPWVSEGYGTLVSGYAPVFDTNHQLVGVVGVDVNISDVFAKAKVFLWQLVGLVLLICILFSIFLLWYFQKSIGKPIRNLSDASKRIALGDLNVDISMESRDEIGELAAAFNFMLQSTRQQVEIMENIADGDLTVDIHPRGEADTLSLSMMKMSESLNRAFASIHTSASNVYSGAQQIADGAQLLAQSSTQQAVSVEHVGGSVDQLTEKAQDNRRLAQQSAELAGAIRLSAQKSFVQMEQMIQAVREVSVASWSIEKVIGIIDDIAFQTNILALNAAVEAARAGQHGKSFSVVADEVRNLAMKSQQAAQDTGAIISDSIAKTELSARLANETALSLEGIVSEIEKSSRMMDKMAELSHEQGMEISRIQMDMQQVSIAIQQNSATSEENAASSEELSSQANLLHATILDFQYRKE